MSDVQCLLFRISALTLSILFPLFCLSAQFEQDDWVTYRDFRYVKGVTKGRDHIFFATSGGILRWDYYRNKWDTPLNRALLPGETQNFDSVTVVASDDNTGFLWCGTNKGLFSFSTTLGDWNRHSLAINETLVQSIGLGGDYIWIEAGNPRTALRILYKGDAQIGGFMTSSNSELEQAGAVQWFGERASLPEIFPQYFVNQIGFLFNSNGYLYGPNFQKFPVTGMVNDERLGYTYLSFDGWGVGRADKNTSRMDLKPNGPAGSKVQAFILNKNEFWSAGKGLSHWLRSEDRWEYFFAHNFASFYSDSILDLHLQDKKLYLATNLGLSILDLETQQFRTLGSIDGLWDSQVTALDGVEGVLWIGTAMGVCAMTCAEGKIIRIGNELIHHQRINDLAVDGNFLWVGTNMGLFLHDIRIGDWTYVPGAPEMMGSAVNDIYAGEKEVWLAREAGIEMFDKDSGLWVGYSSVHTGNHHPLAIIATDSLVWIGTDGGLYKYDRKLRRWHSYHTTDGLPSTYIHQIAVEDDYLWLATDKGLCRFFWNANYRLD